LGGSGGQLAPRLLFSGLSGVKPRLKEASVKPTCPYRSLPDSAFWRSAVGDVDRGRFVPQVTGRAIVGSNTKIASAGSCFAQHIAYVLKAHDFSYMNTEPGPAWLANSSLDLGYGLYPARFGNIYTAAQLLQLFERAFGRFSSAEEPWEEAGRWYDPFRPTIQAGGFASRDGLMADRLSHLAAVREMFETLDVFVFTLGLTEAWRSTVDGAVFPVCPGCEVGTFDPKRHEFINFTARQVVGDLDVFMERLTAINPRAEVIFTVSPVPLAATYSGRHVLEATIYSKSVLRVAAEEIKQKWKNANYFSSYEIITGSRMAEYYDSGLRNVTTAGVSHVMDAFFALYATDEGRAMVRPAEHDKQAETSGKVVCDEDKLAETQARRSSSVR